MTDTDHLELLKRGAAAWNEWRAANPDARPILSGADLSDLDLAEVNLSEIDLSGAELFGANLRRANLKMAVIAGADVSGADLSGAELYKVDASSAYLTEADLTGSYLAEANLRKADLRGARLREANLNGCDLSSADLTHADLTGASLLRADITCAKLQHANFAQTDLVDLEYGSYRSMRGNYHSIRGLDTCFGSALFVRDALDQDYLDTLEQRIVSTPSLPRRALARTLFGMWGLIDYGRSLARPALYAVILAAGYGTLYSLDRLHGWGLVDYSSSANSWLTPFYYSIVTYTTLGFGDVTPLNWGGEIVVVSEVVLGYVTLGLLLSILANKVARRS